MTVPVDRGTLGYIEAKVRRPALRSDFGRLKKELEIANGLAKLH